MNDVIAEYQRWKQQGGDIRSRAKAAIEARFRELLSEAATLAEEYRQDFGTPLKPPVGITAFRYQVGKPKRKPAPATPAPAPKADAPKPEKRILALQTKLEGAKKKLEAAQAAGKPTRDWEDKIYEIEDAIRVASSSD